MTTEHNSTRREKRLPSNRQRSGGDQSDCSLSHVSNTALNSKIDQTEENDKHLRKAIDHHRRLHHHHHPHKPQQHRQQHYHI